MKIISLDVGATLNAAVEETASTPEADQFGAFLEKLFAKLEASQRLVEHIKMEETFNSDPSIKQRIDTVMAKFKDDEEVQFFVWQSLGVGYVKALEDLATLEILTPEALQQARDAVKVVTVPATEPNV